MKLFNKFLKSKIEYSKIIENIEESQELKNNLKDNISFIKDTVGDSSDVIIKDFYVGTTNKINVGIFYIDGLADNNQLQDSILKILMIDFKELYLEKSQPNDLYTLFNNNLPNGNVFEISKFDTLFAHLLSGDTILLIDSHMNGYVISSKGYIDRGIQEPSSQTVIRGPKDSFCETLSTNISLIRRRIKDTNLKIETKQIGIKTQTDVAFVYMKGTAKEKVIDEVRRRLNNIEIDSILESGYIEELIEDHTYTPFPTVYNTERPDAITAGILEGRVAILVDGTPFALLVPAIFIHFFQSPEDYYQRFDISTLTRILRFICFFIALLTPSLYIAVTTFHQDMLPTPLLISLAAQREGLPFPVLIEALIMEIVFEILREAGVRMPRAIGSAISIVGALVLGEAAVQAGIISSVMVIVVSLTAISTFVFPSYNLSLSVRMLRFVFMGLAATLGLYGVAIGMLILNLHLCSLRSFGLNYMSPLAPFRLSSQKDTILRFPLWSIYTHTSSEKNRVRQQSPNIAKSKTSAKN